MSSIIDQYNTELKEHLVIDELNIKDVQLGLPGKKHLWVGRLIRHKQEVNELKTKKHKLIQLLTKQIQEQSSVRLSAPAAEKVAWNMDPIKEINIRIGDLELVIEFLEKVEKIFNGMSFDIKNIIEIQKLETL
jgi:phenylalanyl-tRNA synthetase alpha subunit